MTTVALRNLGRFGNRMFRYAHARALAEQNGWTLRTEPWDGEQIFTLDGVTHERPNGTEDSMIDGYCQNQQSMIYTREDCRRWFAIKPELLPKLVAYASYLPHVHLRRGDYAGAGYPIISRKAVEAAMRERSIEGPTVFVSDEQPMVDPNFTADLAMLPDFYRLMRAPILFRANSTFSFWAGVLSKGRVFSPRIDGLPGGREHYTVPYEEGNHCRCADLKFITDLHLPET